MKLLRGLMMLVVMLGAVPCMAQVNPGLIQPGQVMGNFGTQPGEPAPYSSTNIPFTIGATPIVGGTPNCIVYDTGSVAQCSTASVNAKYLGVSENGIQITATVSITSGQHALAAVGASFVSTDVGKQIIVQGAGTSGAYLTTTISAFTDATHVTLTAAAGTTVTTTSEIVGYGTDDSAAIATAVTAALAGNFTIVFTDGIIFHASTLNWAFNNLHVQFASDNVTFIHTGTGIAHNFNGINNYPGSQGAASGVFGGPGRPMLRGNPAGGTTVGVHIDNWHFGYMKVAIHDAATGLLGTDTGIVSSSSVAGIYDIRVTNQDGPYIITPTRGIDWTAPVANAFSFIVEGAGAASNKCVYLTGAINNSWRGGTVESCVAGGMVEDSTSSRNTYINVDIEANGTAADWTENGAYPTLINSSGAGTTAGSTFGSTGATLIGGKFQSATINDNTLWSNSTNWIVASTNNGSNTTILNPTGAGAPTAVEGATTVFENKTINTANAVTLKINSKQVTDLSGTGTVLATTNSPNITAPTGIVKGDVGLGNVANSLQLVAANNLNDVASAAAARTNLGLGGMATVVPGTGVAAAAAAALNATGGLAGETSGSWSPTDQSGAALTFTAVNCRYQIIGGMVHAYGTFTYPATASVATALIGGLPMTVPNVSYASVPSAIKATGGTGAGIVAVPVINTSTFNIWTNSTGSNLLNSGLTTQTFWVDVIYPAS